MKCWGNKDVEIPEIAHKLERYVCVKERKQPNELLETSFAKQQRKEKEHSEWLVRIAVG